MIGDIEMFPAVVRQDKDSNLTIKVRQIKRVAPIDSGAGYTPLATQTVTDAYVDVGAITLTPSNSYLVYGAVTDDEDTPVEGVLVSATGDFETSDTTDASGDFVLYGIFEGTITITAALDGYVTDSEEVVVTSASVEQDLQCDRVAVSGNITCDEVGLDDVTVSMTDEDNATTSGGGDYSFAPVVDGEKTITPTKVGYEFDPETLEIEVDRESIASNDFVATAVAQETDIDVNYTSGGMTKASGVTYADARDSETASSTGNEPVVGQSCSGTYAVRRSLLNFTIPAMSAAVACSLFLEGGADVSAEDFDIYILISTYATPLGAEDFPVFDGRQTGVPHTGTVLNASWNSVDYSAGWNEIVLNEAGLAAVLAAQGGTLKLALISKKDYDNTAPTVSEYVIFSVITGANKPYLHLSYVA